MSPVIYTSSLNLPNHLSPAEAATLAVELLTRAGHLSHEDLVALTRAPTRTDTFHDAARKLAAVFSQHLPTPQVEVGQVYEDQECLQIEVLHVDKGDVICVPIDTDGERTYSDVFHTTERWIQEDPYFQLVKEA